MNTLPQLTESFDGCPVDFQTGDAYVNATAMCAAFGKRPIDFLRLPRADAFLEALSEELGVSPGDLVITQRGGNQRDRSSKQSQPENLTLTPGTWMHPDLALECARWLSPMLAIWCNRVIRKILSGAQPQVPEQTRTFVESLRMLAAAEEEKERMALENHRLTQGL